MILVIDCGLSAVKLSIADLRGRIIATERSTYPTVQALGVAEQDPRDWWSATVEAASRLDRLAEVTVVVPTGHMHGLVLVDEQLTPLLPCLTLHDRRGDSHLSRFDPEWFRQQTGELLDASLPLSKLMWLADERPELLERACAMLAPKDYLQARLTGRTATDTIDAAGTGLFDPRAGTWCASVVAKSSAPSCLLPAVQPATELAPITPVAAGDLGLRHSVLVAVGAGDDIELLGATAHREGTAVEHVGTTGGVLRPLASANPMPVAPIELYPTSVSSRYAAGASTAQAGAVLDWICNALHVDLEQVLAVAPSGHEPLVVEGLFPERGAPPSSLQGATLKGVRADHDRLDLARGFVVAATMTMRGLLREVEASTGPIREIFASGHAGGLAWARWRASAYGRPLTLLTDDPTTRGAVALGLAALDGGEDLEAIAAELAGEELEIDPQPEFQARFADFDLELEDGHATEVAQPPGASRVASGARGFAQSWGQGMGRQSDSLSWEEPQVRHERSPD